MPPRTALRRLNSTSNSAASALSFPQREQFWQAIVNTEVFDTPLGSGVAEVPEGTVVKAVAKYVDAFNDAWIATADETGTTVWFRELEEADLLDEDRDAEWQITVQDSSAANLEEAAAPVTKRSRTIPKFKQTTNEIDLISFYWDKVFSDGSHRDWNAEYQLAIESILFAPSVAEKEHHLDELRHRLQSVIQEFASHVEKSVTNIITQMFSQSAESKIPKHPSAAGVYYFNGTMFRIAIDASSGGGDDAAMKVFSQHARNVQLLSHVAPKFFFSVPMTLSMVFGGYRIQATSVPPIRIDRGLKVVEGDFVSGMITAVAKELNLNPSVFGDSFGLSPSSSTVVAGLDCRMYLVGLEDILPPLAPPVDRPTYNPAVTSRYWRMRHEAVLQSEAPVSSAAFLSGMTSAENDAVALQATNWIRCVGLSTCAAVLGFMEPCTLPMERITCCGCQKEVDDELRFIVCTSGCCTICAQCNINAFECLTVKSDSAACVEKLRSFVKCDGAALSIRSLRLVPDVVSVLHHHGVNAKFLNVVYSMLPRSAKGVMGYHLEIEMVARAAKTVLQRKLRRKATSVADIGTISAEFFMVLMQPTGPLAEAFWAQELGPAIQELFDVFVPFDTEALDLARVCQRVSELTGVTLTPESVESFARLRDDNADQSGGTESSNSDEESVPEAEAGKAKSAPKPKPSSKHVPSPPRTTTRKSSLSGKPPVAPEKAKKDDNSESKQIEDQRAFIQIQAINPTMKDIQIPMFCEVAGGRRDYLADHLSSLLLFWAGQMDGKGPEFATHEASQPKYLQKDDLK